MHTAVLCKITDRKKLRLGLSGGWKGSKPPGLRKCPPPTAGGVTAQTSFHWFSYLQGRGVQGSSGKNPLATCSWSKGSPATVTLRKGPRHRTSELGVARSPARPCEPHPVQRHGATPQPSHQESTALGLGGAGEEVTGPSRGEAGVHAGGRQDSGPQYPLSLPSPIRVTACAHLATNCRSAPHPPRGSPGKLGPRSGSYIRASGFPVFTRRKAWGGGGVGAAGHPELNPLPPAFLSRVGDLGVGRVGPGAGLAETPQRRRGGRVATPSGPGVGPEPLNTRLAGLSESRLPG